MSYCSKGTLRNFIKMKKEVLMIDKIKFSLGIISGISFLHQNDIIHNDLHSNNVLIGDDQKIKISDFGFSFKLDEKGEYNSNQYYSMRDSFYKSDQKEKTKKRDYFAIATLIYEIFECAEMDNISYDTGKKNSESLKLTDKTPKKIKELILQCWNGDYEENEILINFQQELEILQNKFSYQLEDNIKIPEDKRILNKLKSKIKVFSSPPIDQLSCAELALEGDFKCTSKRCFLSIGEIGFIKFDLNNNVEIESYTISLPKDWRAPSNFQVKISLDNENWTIIDKRENIEFEEQQKYFEFEKKIECKYIQIEKIGKDSWGSDWFQIAYLEFFGKIL